MSINYILKDKQPIPVDDAIAWGRWFEKANRIVKQEELKTGYLVSTVFLGIDCSFSPNPNHTPILFETMVFPKGTLSEVDLERYATWEDAEKGHKRMVKKWKKGLPQPS